MPEFADGVLRKLRWYGVLIFDIGANILWLESRDSIEFLRTKGSDLQRDVAMIRRLGKDSHVNRLPLKIYQFKGQVKNQKIRRAGWAGSGN